MPDSHRILSVGPPAPQVLSNRSAQNPLGGYRDAIFFASGFAGLIYESIWTHYLKLFLGHAAYAQTLVLAIFMGGMAIGAALTARYTARLAFPLRIYALVEATIGVLALAFHPIFGVATGGFYDVTFGWQWGSLTFLGAKWGLATILILPQSILLGATFPLFASAATRGAPAREGRPIATLYFANSIGGAVGVLVSGFVLVPSLGLFGTIATAGALNLAIAMLVIVLSTRATRAAPAGDDAPAAAAKPKPKRAKPLAPTSPAGPPSVPERAVPARLLLAVSFLTGASSFIYEIGWIRMLSLVLGSATHSFELMLSSFVLGLALGGLWIRKRIDSAKNPAVFLGYIQIAMGCAALATVPLHNVSFNIVGWTLAILPKTDDGYVLFNLMRYGIASLIMFPAAFCAGMTLPLLTRLLYSNAGQGERSIGLIYSTNTLGAIVGLAFAVHIGMPVFGLEYLVATGAVIDVLLGAALFTMFGARSNRRLAFAAVVLSVAATFIVAQTFDPQKLASSVFRTGEVSTRGTIVEVAHGKTATISVETEQGSMAIKTNGKTDASANMNPGGHYTPDELTMAMIGVVTLMLHDAPRQVANIGFGSGLTGELILADPRVLHLDTIEIEPKMVDLARHFDPLNRSVYTDPRSAVRIEDAKSFFAANGKTYDVILSEPSNPWVSGVSGLFSVEFYRHVSRYLNQGGLFAQWLHSYETNPDRIVSVLKAMDQAFDDYMVIAIDDADVVFVGRPHGKVAMPPNAYAALSPQMKAKMRNLDIANQADVAFRIVGNKALFRPWLDAIPVAANSDFTPYLDSNADRDRFFDQDWPEFINVALSAIPIAEILGGRPPLPTPSALSITRQFGAEPLWLGARLVWETLFGPAKGPDAFPVPNHLPPNLARRGAEIIAACTAPAPGASALGAARLATRVLPYLSPTEGRAVLAALHGAACLDPAIGDQAQWANLLRYLADRDADGFGNIADQMLVSGQGTTVVLTRYLLALAMLGRIHAGKHDRAAALWTQFSRKALDNQPPGLVLELLRAHAMVTGP